MEHLKTTFWFIAFILVFVLVAEIAKADTAEHRTVTRVARANGFKPSPRVVNAIVEASKAYGINVRTLTVIAIVETGLGRYERTVLNKNGTKDVGLFQINEVNHDNCVEYSLDTPEGSSMCAAKLLAALKRRHQDFVVRYHSHTLKHRIKYARKISSVYEKLDK